jgi:hypothetical protein
VSFILQLADIASWFGAGLLVFSAALKVAHPRYARQFMAELRFPATGVAVTALVLCEVIIAAAVIAVDGTRLPRAAEAALFGTFASAIGMYMWKGRVSELL